MYFIFDETDFDILEKEFVKDLKAERDRGATLFEDITFSDVENIQNLQGAVKMKDFTLVARLMDDCDYDKKDHFDAWLQAQNDNQKKITLNMRK